MQGLDEETRQRIVAMEGLLHWFGVRTEAREQELHQWLEESHAAAFADLVKDMHELRQFTIKKQGRRGPQSTTIMYRLKSKV